MPNVLHSPNRTENVVLPRDVSNDDYQEANVNAADDEQLINIEDSESEYSSLHRKFEELQNQMHTILSIVETSTLQTQSSITSLQNEMRNIAANQSQNSESVPSLQTASNSINTINHSTTNPPPGADRTIRTAIPSSTILNQDLNHTAANIQQIEGNSIPNLEAASYPYGQINVSQHQKKIYPLPKFSGLPEDWQTFYESFISSTREFQYSDLHNIMRLQDSLEGRARDTVESLLSNSKNVASILETLMETYGRPEQLIKSQILKIRSLPSVRESDLSSLITYANKVVNMTIFVQSVGGNYHLTNPILLSELVAKLPMSKRLQWAEKCLTLGQMPTVSDFSSWLKEIRKVINMVSDSLPPNDETRKFACASVERENCKLCNGACKSLSLCEMFLELSVQDRWEKVKLLKHCFSCLRKGHQTKKCNFKKRCNQNSCSSFHNKLLHNESPFTQDAPNVLLNESLNSSISTENINENRARNCLTELNNEKRSVLFQIIPVTVYGPHKSEIVYAFVDDGANVSMVDATIIKRLGITGHNHTLELQWINNQTTREQTKIVNFWISGVGTFTERYSMSNVYVTSKLNLPTQSFNRSMIPQNTNSAHMTTRNLPNYTDVQPKMIISLAHVFLTVGLGSPRMLSPSGPVARKTRLGWITYGPINIAKQKGVSCHISKIESETEPLKELENIMKSYFAVETFGIKTPIKQLISKEDQRALEILENTTIRLGDRFECGLLWRDNFSYFPPSYGMAYKRLTTVEKKMSKDPEFAKEYCTKIEEYVEKGYARILSEEEAKTYSEKTFYLPHFGVMNPNKNKLRLVFDAAAETMNMSLNKALLSGPDINKSLLSILFKFRQSKVAVCADLKEMFHQVIIKKDDQDAQRFLWRNGDPSKPPRTYIMQRMIFGATCSPTTAQYVKNKNAGEFARYYPRAVKAIKEKHYVDDYVDCFDSESEAIEVINAVEKIHNSGGFEMHNIITNSIAVAKALNIVNDDTSFNVEKTVERILGMHWLPKQDKFIFSLKFHKVSKEVLSKKRVPTKRELLCITMSVFDPFGLVADFMISIKLLMQDVWKCGINWDDKVPVAIYLKFIDWLNELPKLEAYNIPRFYFNDCVVKSIQLHIFCDASEEAMAAVAYWRVSVPNGIKVSFIAGKTACAPLRYTSIPRLELQAAIMAVRLKESIISNHEIAPNEIILWTDSRTVVRWIQSDHRKYKQYVANRVSEIIEFSQESQWRWCPTSENPADRGTRSKHPINYNPEGAWKNGPRFLSLDRGEWPTESDTMQKEILPKEELKSKYFVMATTSHINIIDVLINRTSNYIRVRRQIAWIWRFITNTQRKCKGEEPISGELTVEEEKAAETLVLREIQRTYFLTEYEKLKIPTTISKSSDLITLNPYLDSEGIIRSGGRLDNAEFLPEYTRRPIILPKSHRYSHLIVKHYHIRNCHQNSAKVICDVRERFWIASIRRLLKTVEAQCNFCKIRKAKPVQPQMSILPKDRVTPFMRTFSYTGVDIFGPFDVRIRRCTEKRWVALFTCLTVRAVHLEIVNNMSSDAFILCLRNFINRRGVPIQIRSDNGSNFVGVKKELRNEENFLDHNEITRFLSPLGIKWIFNTPCDPSSGGAWERLVQSIKKSLSVLLKENSPRLEVFQSLLIEAESIVNSRPLTHIPLSPQDPEPLTPNHFLLGTTNSTQTPIDFDKKLMNMRKQWRILQNLKNGYWNRWITEYLPDLTRRVKWCLPSDSIQVGDITLICDVKLPRSKWKMGRIVNVYRGNDGISRSADIQTTDGTFKRPTSILAKIDFN